MSSTLAGSRLLLTSTLTPFLYPCLDSSWSAATSRIAPRFRLAGNRHSNRRWQTTTTTPTENTEPSRDLTQYDHLNPQPSDYSETPFTDACTLTVAAGNGGHGCISFLREKYVPDGPPNGGDGGTGGSIYIQAVRGETSLHKLARRGTIKADRGRNGQGTSKGGKRGEDILLTVPVGTVIREVSRNDPIAEDEAERKRIRKLASASEEAALESEDPEIAQAEEHRRNHRREKWLLHPAAIPHHFHAEDFPSLPPPRRNVLAMSEPRGPIRLDLNKPMEVPMLLAAGAVGGLGNTHFVTTSRPKPKFATKGDSGIRISLQLELKLLADVGLVGLPNAGKSTLLRALTSSRARIGDWAFTTLAPNIGTVVLDNQRGRLDNPLYYPSGELRTNFTIADIPGLIEDAHLDRGLGLGFLRHIERAGVLAFVVDLSAGDAIQALKGLWKEVGEYENMRAQELAAASEKRHIPNADGTVSYAPGSFGLDDRLVDQGHGLSAPEEATLLQPLPGQSLPPLALPPISAKPWLVIATKADKPETQENFKALQTYLENVEAGNDLHPSGKKDAWCKKVRALPVCAMKKEGVPGVRAAMTSLLAEFPTS
jgi:GTP-binding protein